MANIGRPAEYGPRERTSLVFSAAFLAELDGLRGQTSRSVYIEQTLRRLWGISPLEKLFVMNKALVKAIQQSIAESQAVGMDADDVKWMATGAGIRYGRDLGVIPQDEVSTEMAAAIKAVVEEEVKRRDAGSH